MRIICAIALIVWSICAEAQEGTFEYDQRILRKYAITALEEYNAHQPNAPQDLARTYELEKAISYSRLVTDCDENKIRVVIFAFPEFDSSGSAVVHLSYNKDNFFDQVLNREYSTMTAEEVIDDFRNNDIGDDLFGCGL